MQKFYVYNGETYRSAYNVKRAIEKAENTRFGAEPKDAALEELQTFWSQHNVEYREEPDPEPPKPTEEELAAQELERKKRYRAAQVAAIQVTVDGMVFDGDETAQTRMGRTIAAAVALGVDIETYTQIWVLADNTVATPTIKQLAQALKLAGEAQTNYWTAPYEETENKVDTQSLAKVGI